jgi:hypothetical protein
MSCQWLFLGSLTTAERLCGEPGHPYCDEHRNVLDNLKQLDNDFVQFEPTHKAVCEQPRRERRLFVVRKCRPVHTDCVYSEECCADDALNLLGPEA